MLIYPNPTPILSKLYTFSSFKTPIFGSQMFTSISGKETRIQTQIYPIWEFRLKFDALRSQTQNIVPYAQWSPKTDYEKILATFLACKGRYGRFFYQDLTDCSRAGQVLGDGNGTQTRFRIQRSFGDGSFVLSQPVGGVDLSETVTVYLDGIPTVDYTISDNLQVVVFNSPVSDGVTVTMDFYFFYLCRFLQDASDFEEFMMNLHSNGEFGFVSVKDDIGAGE